MRELLTPAYFTIEGMSIEFETTPEFVRSVLPPCFEPADQSTGLATTSRWQAGVCGEFESTAVMINALNEGVLGTYFLTLIVSGDMPVTIGREFWGEPKKLGDTHFFRDGDTIYAYGERNGTRIVEIEATFGPDLGPREMTGNALELAGAFTHDARLAHDPVALTYEVGRSFTSVREGSGTLTLTGTAFDPLDEIPLVSTGKALHYTGEASYKEISRRELVGEADTYLPYILGRSFDDLTEFPRPLRHRDRFAPGTGRMS